jgi:TRAP-type C4-dicarboxylate transport system substrate-binding protein
MTALPITHSTSAILISSKYFNRIPEELRELVKAEINISMEELSDEMNRQAKESIEIIRKNGLKIIPMPKGSPLEEFRSLHKQVTQDLTNVIFPKELLEKVYKILEKHRQIQ